MHLFEIIALAFALSMDAFAVALATGVQLRCISGRQAFRLSFHFGLFQCFMPIIGWYLGTHVRAAIEAWDHWVAFTLLSLVGGKMIYDACKQDDEDIACADPTRGMSLIMLSVATSIDALAVGLSLALLHVSIWTAAVSIGLICGVLTLCGLHIGRIASSASNLGARAAVIGGVVLIGLGIKTLHEHQVF